MPDVKHMKWWGWGVEGVAFHHEDKPGFRPFVIEAVDLDVTTEPTAVRTPDLPDVPRPLIPRRAGRRAAATPSAPDNVVTTDDGPDRPHLRQERARPAPAAGRRHPAGARRGGLPRQRGRGAAGRRPCGRGQRGPDPVRRRQQHLRQPAGAAGRDPAGDLGRPGPDEPGALDSTRSPGWPGSRPARSGRTWRSSCAPAAGPSATSPTASPTARSAAGSRPGPPACSRTSTATSPRSPAASAWCSRARCW